MMNLGEKEFVAGWTFDGWVTAEELTKVLLDTVVYVEMTVFDDPVVRDFPTSDGKGGEGSMAFVMLHESGIMGNTYQYVKHDKTEKRVRILLASCKQFMAYDVGVFLKNRLDLPMICRGQFTY